jgi:hypothetical protein
MAQEPQHGEENFIEEVLDRQEENSVEKVPQVQEENFGKEISKSIQGGK